MPTWILIVFMGVGGVHGSTTRLEFSIPQECEAARTAIQNGPAKMTWTQIATVCVYKTDIQK